MTGICLSEMIAQHVNFREIACTHLLLIIIINDRIVWSVDAYAIISRDIGGDDPSFSGQKT